MRHLSDRIIVAAGIILCAVLLLPAQSYAAAAGYDAAMTKAATELGKKQYFNARTGAMDALRLARTPDERAKAAQTLREVLTQYAALETHAPEVRLTLALQVAGTHGLAGDENAMQAPIDAALANASDLPVAQRIKALWEAAVFYVQLRENEVARVLDHRKDQLQQAHTSRNVYHVRYVAQAPLGVGGWRQSSFLNQKTYRDARFHPYPQRGDAYALVADMAADRPLEEREDATAGERATSFYMLYDDAGWHIYIEAQEPDVQEIMMAGGRGGSSLEMFLSPGLEVDTYDQIMLSLGTGKVNLYNWGSPNRAYRPLREGPGGIKVESLPLEDRWAVAIFIPWHFFHDKLPFMAGNANVWRFTLTRFGPVRMTWGGRVHETGSWGLIQWEPPAADEQTNILRRLIRQAALKFQQTQQAQATFWKSEQIGDPLFYKERLEPAIKQYEALVEETRTVGQWPSQRVEQVFGEMVPIWMEFDYTADELRSRYLTEQLLAGN